ncbi:MAG: heterodisulfide reductase-related iron-sulfur binding cluster [Pseudomonadota bacterium]
MSDVHRHGQDENRGSSRALAQHGVRLRERLIAELPRLGPIAARLAPISNAVAGLPALKRAAGISAARRLPRFQAPYSGQGAGDVLLFADTFNRYFEPETLHAAARVIGQGGVRVGVAHDPGRPLCCGRTYLSAGMTDRALAEMRRTTQVLRAALDRGQKIVGLEPSCTLMFRDEVPNLLSDWTPQMGAQILTFAEYMAAHPPQGLRLDGPALVHGHCHQKAMGVAQATVAVLNALDGCEAEMIDSSCCGMAGPFGYQAETEAVSRRMAELALAPAVRAAPAGARVVADGFSCRCQISDVAGRKAQSLAQTLDQALEARAC